MNTFKSIIKESPVGSTGRTTHADADDYINKNPDIIAQFRKIVNSMGGKSVARRVLDRMGSKKEQDILTMESVIIDIEKYLRDNGLKLKHIYPNQDGTKEIEFYNTKDRDLSLEIIGKDNILKDKVTSVSIASILVAI